jgi:hypothetical protein
LTQAIASYLIWLTWVLVKGNIMLKT